MPSILLRQHTTYKIGLKRLFRLLLNQYLNGDSQELSKELYENVIGASEELIRLEKAGLLLSEEQGRHKVYVDNMSHPLITGLSNINLMLHSLEAIINRVASNFGNALPRVWITGALAKGIYSDVLKVSLVGDSLVTEYSSEEMRKTESLIVTTKSLQVCSSYREIDSERRYWCNKK